MHIHGPEAACEPPSGKGTLGRVVLSVCVLFTAGADKKAEAGAGAATEFQFVSNAS